MEHFGDAEAYIRFVEGGMKSSSPWKKLQGQIWLGGESFRTQMQRRIPHQGVADIPSEQLQPLRPDSGVILHAVAGYFGCETEDVLSRRHQEGYLLAVFLLRRMANRPLADVADLFGVSSSRISQIQRKILDGMLKSEMNELINKYKLKN